MEEVLRWTVWYFAPMNGVPMVPSHSSVPIGRQGRRRLVHLALFAACIQSGAGQILAAPLLPDDRTVVVQVGSDDPFQPVEGVVRLSGKSLRLVANQPVRSLAIADIALMAGSGDTLPSARSRLAISPGLELLPLERRDHNHDGILDDDDEILFWGRSTSLWKWNADIGEWIRSFHPYQVRGQYFVKLGAARPSPDLPEATGATYSPARTSVPALRWVGRPNQRLEHSTSSSDPDDPETGNGWYWTHSESPVDVSLDREGLADLPGLALDTGAMLVYHAATDIDADPARVNFRMVANGRSFDRSAVAGNIHRFGISGLLPRGNSIALPSLSKFHLAGASLRTWTDSRVDSLAFPAWKTGGISAVVPEGLDCWALEKGRLARKCRISAGAFHDSAGQAETWYSLHRPDCGSIGVTLSAWKEGAESHLRRWNDTLAKAAILVVVPDEFLSVAEDYAKWRESDFQVRKMSVAVVRTRDVWSGFSGGLDDPSALREAIRWAKDHWAVSHVLLLGGGSGDPRRLTRGSNPTWIPQWESTQFSSDEFYAMLDSGNSLPDIALGRVPARTLGEAQAWFSKLKRFEDPQQASFGPWRNTILTLADDQRQGQAFDPIKHAIEADQILSTILAKRPWMRRRNIFMGAYPATASTFKPDVQRDLVQGLSGEAGAFLFMGHGSPQTLTDEVVLDQASFQRLVRNPGRPWLTMLGSCSVGRHDQVSRTGLLTDFVLSAENGAYSGIAATRATYPENNKELLARVWSGLMDGSTLGEALLAAKRLTKRGGDVDNSSFYNLLGDPAVIPYPGGLQVELDSLPPTLSPLSRLEMTGRASGGKADLELRIEKKMPRLALSDAVSVRNKDGSSYVRRDTSVVDQPPLQFSGQIQERIPDSWKYGMLLPARLPPGDTAWVKAYAWDPLTRREGGAVSRPRPIGGMGAEIPDDHRGPRITLRLCDSSWGAGIGMGGVAKIPLPVCLEALLEDSSGISSSLEPDEGVVFSLPGIRDAWHPSLVVQNSLKSVSARLEIDSALLPPGGRYPFRVNAADLMGNHSQAEVTLEPQGRGAFSVYDLFASPNPVRDDQEVVFAFKVVGEPDSAGALDSRTEASIRISTLSGKLVKIVRTELPHASRPRPQARWDLRDAFGARVANGIYPYCAVVRIPEAYGIGTRQYQVRGLLVVSR